jgi:disulfide bond formation protein DsbB
MPSRRQANALLALACAAALGYAFYAQYGLGLVPCHLCIFQRVTLAALGIAFVVAALISRPGGRGVFSAAMIALAGLATAATAGRHVWIQMQPEGSVPACGAWRRPTTSGSSRPSPYPCRLPGAIAPPSLRRRRVFR